MREARELLPRPTRARSHVNALTARVFPVSRPADHRATSTRLRYHAVAYWDLFPNTPPVIGGLETEPGSSPADPSPPKRALLSDYRHGTIDGPLAAHRARQQMPKYRRAYRRPAL